MKHYGDITQIRGDAVEPVDVVTGGSPCQDLSTAGKRAGLAGERSGLFMEQIRIIKEMRRNDELHCGRTGESIRPRFMVWENVAGAFSSNGGEDFRAVLEETARVVAKDAVIPRPERWSYSGCIMGDGWSIAWRTHDAQFWGVPQHRRRIALVADFGGCTAAEILFEREGMSRDTEQGEQARKDAPESVGEHASSAGAFFVDVYNGTVTKGASATVTAAVGGANTSGPKVIVAFGVTTKGNGDAFISEERHTSLVCGGGQAGQGYPCVIASQPKALNSWGVQSKHIQSEDGIAEALYSGECRYGGGESYVLQNQSVVRRLTPKECERLQGFPDGWTNIGDWVDSKGKMHKGDSDSPRYKALGNSIALPFWQWLAHRIAAHLPQGATMASLFDGIGGFPLVFSRCVIRPVWASEIEEFPIAVTRKHFPE